MSENQGVNRLHFWWKVTVEVPTVYVECVQDVHKFQKYVNFLVSWQCI